MSLVLSPATEARIPAELATTLLTPRRVFI
jgi:hypothetical protein